MGKFDKFKGKGKSKTGNIVRINKYDNKSAVLDLISHIVTANDDFEIAKYFSPILDYAIDFGKEESDKVEYEFLESKLSELEDEIKGNIFDFIDKLESNHGLETITIAVGGGYSSGKSSFINKLTGLGNLLPTGVEPVSIVNTSLTFSSSVQNLVIRGKNFKRSYVRLNKDVLESIQHSSKSKVYVASVLDELLIDLPANEKKYLDGVTLIDTPGYNNSEAKNIENEKTDSATALEAMQKADAFIWCIDIEAGTIPSKDMEMLKQIIEKEDNRPYVILFTKRDKKELSDQKDIINNAYKIAEKTLPYMPFAIMGFSDRQDNNYLTSKGKEFDTFIKSLKSNSPGLGVQGTFENIIDKTIDQIKDAVKEWITSLESERKELSKKKSEVWSDKNETSKISQNKKEVLRDIVINDYDALLESISEHRELINFLFEKMKESFYREIEWSNKSGFFSDTSSLLARHNKAIEEYDSLDFPKLPVTYNDEQRQTIVEMFSSYCDDDIKDMTEYVNNLTEEYNNLVAAKREGEKCIKDLSDFQKKIKPIISRCVSQFLEDIKKHYEGIKMEEETVGDIFTAIASDNVQRFTSCLSDGVDFSVCNNLDYNPLTFAVHCGNNEMVKYLIDHDVDLEIKDKRGYNAFETAVIDHYQDICKMILDKHPNAIYTDKSIDTLYNQNTFFNWIKSI